MMRIGIAAFAIALACLAGFALSQIREQGLPGDRTLSQWVTSSSEPRAADLEQREGAALVELRESLDREIAARSQLAAEVEQLRGELRALAAPGLAEEAAQSRSASSPAMIATDKEQETFDASILDSAGFSPAEIDDLQERFADLAMERLYLRDRAVREGWLRTPRYAAETSALNSRFEALREEFGEERYDSLLFAAGRSNRVLVQDVFSRSPAAEAGVRSGDRILRYDERRIFDVNELRRATTEGRAGDLVPLEIDRDGERLRLYIPRGPLGVQLHPDRQGPLTR